MSQCWSRLRAELAIPGVLASAAVKNYTDLWLKQQMLFLPVLEAEKSKIEVPVDKDLGQVSFWLAEDHFLAVSS